MFLYVLILIVVFVLLIHVSCTGVYFPMQIYSHTLRVVQKLEARVRIEVLAVGGLDGPAVCSLAGLLDLESEQDFNESRKAASEK